MVRQKIIVRGRKWGALNETQRVNWRAFPNTFFPVWLSKNNTRNPDGDCTSANQSPVIWLGQTTVGKTKIRSKIHLVCKRNRIKIAWIDWTAFLGIYLFSVTTRSLTWPETRICSHIFEESNAMGLEVGGGGGGLRQGWGAAWSEDEEHDSASIWQRLLWGEVNQSAMASDISGLKFCCQSWIPAADRWWTHGPLSWILTWNSSKAFQQRVLKPHASHANVFAAIN